MNEMETELLEAINSKLDLLLERTKHLDSDKSILDTKHLNIETHQITGLKKLADKLNVEEEKLRTVIEIDDSDIVILRPIQGNSDFDKMFKASLIISCSRYFVFGIDMIDTKYLIAKIEALGINHNRNLGKVFKNGVEYFIPKSKSKVRTSEYKITLPCQLKGLELINELLKGE